MRAERKQSESAESQVGIAGMTWRLRIPVICASGAAAGFLVGLVCGTGRYGLGQPGILLLAFAAVAPAAMTKRMVWGATAGLSMALAGAVGLVLRISLGEPVNWGMALPVLAVMAALPCTIVGAVSGLVSDVLARPPADARPKRRDHN